MTTETSVAPPVSNPPITRLGWVSFGTALVAVIADQLSKAWVLGPLDLPARFTVPVLPFFSLTMVWNPGVSFGLLRASDGAGRFALSAFSAVVIVALAWWARRAARPINAVALGLIMGGALGNNLIDRMRFGRVVDFLDFSGLHFPWVFNIADSCISVGVALLLIDTLMPAKTPLPSA
jgi:signal peptidase II